MKVKAWMFSQPFFDVRILLAGLIVDNQMHIQGLVCLCIELLQRLEKFVITMAWQTFTDNSYLTK
ncbi:MAG TPA: hypothetical protein DEO56_05335 [Nitrosomonas nitrosa]|nr:hypothetical protein [Nitrosomonas nitrosa]